MHNYKRRGPDFNFSPSNLRKKNAKLISLGLGGFYTVLGLMSLLMILLQTKMLPSFELESEDPFMVTLNILHILWLKFMPVLLCIGLAYLTFGYFFDKIEHNRLIISIILGLLSFIWVIAYLIGSIEYADHFIDMIKEDFPGAEYVGYIFAIFGSLGVLSLCTIPSFLIIRKIKRETTHETR